MLTTDRRLLPKIIDQTLDLKYKSLICGGCSFTSGVFLDDNSFFEIIREGYNRIKDRSWQDLRNSIEDFFQLPLAIQQECRSKGLNLDVRSYMENYITWPYFLADRIGIDTVYNCAYPGAGNQHVFNSIVNAIELDARPDPANTLVMIMWSGYERDDFIVGNDCVTGETYRYSDVAKLAFTGGLLSGIRKWPAVTFRSVQKSKNDQSRALENYLLIVALASYLKGKGFDYVFTEMSTDKKGKYLDIRPLFSDQQLTNFNQLVSNFECLGDRAVDLVDGFHPSTAEHKKWIDQVVVPFLTTSFNPRGIP